MVGVVCSPPNEQTCDYQPVTTILLIMMVT
jgi:hypothetical protein